MTAPPTWGVVATVKASAEDILRFAAYHLDLGAHRVFIYLDADNPVAHAALKAHPKCRVTRCTPAYWAKNGRTRPAKHQVRQTRNATRAYGRADVDWLAHIDVDEFLVAQTPIADILASLEEACNTARVRPMELLADGDGTAYKAFIPPGPERARAAQVLYPTFGQGLSDGFLSHLAGKLFVRTRLGAVDFRIHNVFLNGEKNPGAVELDAISLAHHHTTSWAHWSAAYRYRVDHGSYRAELSPAHNGKSLHALLAGIEMTEGQAGLRAFFDEVCADTPELRAALQNRHILRIVDLKLDQKRHAHFPGV